MRKIVTSWQIDFDIDNDTLDKIKKNYPRHYNSTIDYMNKLKDIIYNKNKS